ncbi:MAG: T9SS type A sorting domain-containing protein [Phaeodactylibacter sp.]|uniref:T9SS type A sorting domain-containing protein n=1 Tax=Phaeodactylibacter sp. TaxID=1940289 RepID=UPI0032EF31AC
MKKIYLLSILFLGLGFISNAQRFVLIEASADPANPANIFPVIMGDTTANGDRVDNNTVYQLENGQVYVSSGRLVNKPEWPLQIQAVDLQDTENKAIITRIPNASGDYQDIMRAEGDVTFLNLWIIAGEVGPLELHDWGRMRILGEGSRVIVRDCIIEKERGGFLQMRANNVKCYVENSILRNGGNRRVLQGNGRGIDARDFYFDTLVVRNTIVHNIQDRFFRSQGGSQPHNYIEIDHCTSFNTIGRHGHIQLGRILTAKITNNLFINPIMLGSSPIYTDEQTQPDGDLHKVITVDTLYEGTDLEISANNIFWTEDVTDYWASNDTVSAPGVLSQLIEEHLGSEVGNAFFQEQLELNNVPERILQYVIDLYNDPSSINMYDFIVEDVAVAGTPFDSGNLFDFSEFAPCYSPNTESATASTNGGAVGAVGGCEELINSTTEVLNSSLQLTAQPNPTAGATTFRYTLDQSSQVALSLHSLSGQKVATVFSGYQVAGEQYVEWGPVQAMPAGLYIARLQTEEGVMALKMIVR